MAVLIWREQGRLRGVLLLASRATRGMQAGQVLVLGSSACRTFAGQAIC